MNATPPPSKSFITSYRGDILAVGCVVTVFALLVAIPTIGPAIGTLLNPPRTDPAQVHDGTMQFGTGSCVLKDGKCLTVLGFSFRHGNGGCIHWNGACLSKRADASTHGVCGSWEGPCLTGQADTFRRGVRILYMAHLHDSIMCPSHHDVRLDVTRSDPLGHSLVLRQSLNRAFTCTAPTIPDAWGSIAPTFDAELNSRRLTPGSYTVTIWQTPTVIGAHGPIRQTGLVLGAQGSFRIT